jgi:peptidoglycan hydrolase CwlO-like protein
MGVRCYNYQQNNSGDEVMLRRFNRKWKMVIAFLIIPVMIAAPLPASGEVAPIEDTREKIENISEEEMEVLERLFLISKEIEALEAEEVRIQSEITAIKGQVADLERTLDGTQQSYNEKLTLLETVLVYYQRGGPATYLEILLGADSFSEFLKSINVIKDISHNVADLLTSLENNKKLLEEEKQQLDRKVDELTKKQVELSNNLSEREAAHQEQESYLSGLEENRNYYEEQLQNLELLWEDCKKLFTEIVSETTRIIGEGRFTAEDLNLGMGLFNIPGAIEEDTFNRVLKENSQMSETIFHFNDGQVEIEVPELHLVLRGNFLITGDSAIQYQVAEGTFYDLPLDELSIHALFEHGPMTIDFAAIAGDIEIADFILQEVESKEGQLAFVIKLKW